MALRRGSSLLAAKGPVRAKRSTIRIEEVQGELAGPFARPGEVQLHAEVHLLPGEDLPAPNARLEDVSLGALEMMVQVWPPAGP